MEYSGLTAQARNIALLIEYDGTAYGGWQIQKNSDSVQGEIEKSLSEMLREKVRLTGAGRTDAGVHAKGQVANFFTSSEWSPAKFVSALNGTLPPDIAIRAASEVRPEFHSRFDAIARRYSYRIIARKTPIDRAFAAFFPFTLSLENMNSAAEFLRGEMSFKAFTKYADQQRHFTCNLAFARWSRDAEVLVFEIEANRFLHGMVRAIVGTLVDVGRGKLTIDDFHSIINSGERALASMSAPACGLCLEEVKYGFEIW
jgi:tRNA pseudouridine38-40 synthase